MLNTSRNEVEMNDLKTKRKFLKKTKLDPQTLRVSDFTKGATVVLLARELLLVDYADRVTREHLEQNEETINVLVSPSVYGSIGDVVSSIEASFPLVDIKSVSGNDDDVCVLLSFRGCGSIASVSAMVESSPLFSHGLRACPNDAEVGKNRLTTATLDNCTCCVIRPHIVKERKVGAVVSDITSRGFTISAMQMVRLDKTASAEFLNVYKGVLPDYVDLVDEMSSGPCLVLEVKKGSRSSSIDEEDDIVEEFRMACGPWDHSVACELHPESIRAKFGTSSVKNAVHCTDLPKDGKIECGFFFK
jgi:nucleoside-diphosphate kinase